MFGFLSFRDLSDRVAAGVDKVPLGVDLVVGIPRSGMIPAYMIALYRNISVVDLPAFLEDRIPESGFRRAESARLRAMDAKWILLVDDSISTGRAMNDALHRIRESGYTGTITTCAIVAEHSHYDDVDLAFCEMPHPRLFEWNAFHRPGIVENSCFDLDGVLCVDPIEEDNDDGPRYRTFLANARPRFRPTLTIGHIVSARLEKYRDLTEKWLSDNGISYGQLHLIDLPTAADRVRLRAHCPHKAKVYSESGATMFFESDASQAQEIARLTSKPVLCTDEMRLYLPGMGLRSAPKLMKWKLAKPIGRLRARIRSIGSLIGFDIEGVIVKAVKSRRR